jgi:hypothetical protein
VFVIKVFDIFANLLRPIVYNAGITPVTPRLIRKLPCKDRRAALVTIDQELDVVFVNFLAAFICIPRRGIAAEGGVVAGNTT